MKKDQFHRKIQNCLDDYFDWDLHEAQEITNELWAALIKDPPEEEEQQGV